MHVLRAEKGYIVIGQETDGTVTPDDLGLGWAVGQSKDDFVGKRSLRLADMQRPARRQLVGLLSDEVLEEGAQVTAGHGPSLGHVTSAYWSEAAGSPIALALIAGGRTRLGQTLLVPMPGREIALRVADPVFYDRDGSRLHG